MLTIILLCTIATLWLVRLLLFYSKTPPGPFGIPIFGYIPFLSDQPHRDFVHLAKKYGDVFSMQLGERYVIVLNSAPVIKEALLKQGPFFEGRPKEGPEVDFCDHVATAMANGELWRTQRRFLLSALRDFGFGKTRMEQHILEEAKYVTESMLATKGQTFNVSILAQRMTSNIISCLIFGRRFSHKDNKVTEVLELISETMNQYSFFSTAYSFPSITRLIPDNLSGMDKWVKLKDIIYEFIDERIDEHLKTYNENDIRDVLDVYILKAKHAESTGEDPDIAKIYSRKYIGANMNMLYVAGSDTTANLFSWFCRLMGGHTDIQKRAQNEIDDVIGHERPPTMNDRTNLPYNEAVLLEVFRFISLGAVSNYHRVTGETVLNGYRIPKDACMVVNLWNLHHDPKIWSHPEVFDPERYLDENGKLNKLRENVLPFSVGKRNCLGESLARMELFLFTVAILQKFTLKLPEGEKWVFKPDLYLPMVKCKISNIRAIPRNV